MNYLPEILLLLFALNLGIAFGAGIYEAQLIIPRWFPKLTEIGYRVDTEAMFQFDSGRKFWAFITTGPLTLLTLSNFAVAWQSPEPAYYWWLASVFIALIERTATFTFFIPTIIKLQHADKLPASGLSRLTSLWIRFNYSRNALTLLACLCALIALAL